MGMKEDMEKLRAENEALKAKANKPISMKIGEKGGMSLYGLGRFPVTLYKQQWTRLLEHTDQIRAFLRENDDKLKGKD